MDMSHNRLVGMQLSTTLQLMKSVIAREFEKSRAPISFDDWLCLVPLIERDGISQKEFGQILGKDKTTISRQVQAFEKRGLVNRVKSLSDKRAVELRLSDSARRQHKAALPLIQELDREFLGELSRAETRSLVSLVAKLRTGVLRRKDGS
jgi:DNA-binding MarR family transcriptional regulator